MQSLAVKDIFESEEFGRFFMGAKREYLITKILMWKLKRENLYDVKTFAVLSQVVGSKSVKS